MLGWNVFVHRLLPADRIGSDQDASPAVARLQPADSAVGDRLPNTVVGDADWVFEGVADGSVVVIEEAGGYPNRYLVRGRDCPTHVDGAASLDEWLYIEVWDQS